MQYQTNVASTVLKRVRNIDCMQDKKMLVSWQVTFVCCLARYMRKKDLVSLSLLTKTVCRNKGYSAPHPDASIIKLTPSKHSVSSIMAVVMK